MALLKEAQRIAAEFEYSPAELNKGVKAFIDQMDEGLGKRGTHMSQIPTYVTAVPNGTEKVESINPEKSSIDFGRVSILLWILEAPISECAR